MRNALVTYTSTHQDTEYNRNFNQDNSKPWN